MITQYNPSEIVHAMVRGLENPAFKVDMNTFGRYDPETGTCFGCAAANALAQLRGLKKTEAFKEALRQEAPEATTDYVPEEIHREWENWWAPEDREDYDQIELIEVAVDALRHGYGRAFLAWFEGCAIEEWPAPVAHRLESLIESLTALYKDSPAWRLEPYTELANYLEALGA